MPEQGPVPPNRTASNILRWSPRRTYLINLRTLAQAAVTTLSRPESALGNLPIGGLFARCVMEPRLECPSLGSDLAVLHL
jgi:hypothetical protein